MTFSMSDATEYCDASRGGRGSLFSEMGWVGSKWKWPGLGSTHSWVMTHGSISWVKWVRLLTGGRIYANKVTQRKKEKAKYTQKLPRKEKHLIETLTWKECKYIEANKLKINNFFLEIFFDPCGSDSWVSNLGLGLGWVMTQPNPTRDFMGWVRPAPTPRSKSFLSSLLLGNSTRKLQNWKSGNHQKEG